MRGLFLRFREGGSVETNTLAYLAAGYHFAEQYPHIDPPMIADELRRQADVFTDLME